MPSAPPMAPLAPLAQVHSVLQRSAPALLALPHVTTLLSDYLDGSLRCSLPHAASSGFVSLLERVAAHTKRDTRLSPVLLDHWYARAMANAIERNDLLMVQKIHSLHPEPLVVHSLQLAMEFGSLELVQWTVEHRHDRMCCAPGIQNVCRACLLSALCCLGKRDAFRIIQWLDCHDDVCGRSPLYHVLLQSVELTRWYDERGLLTETTARRVLRTAISGERVEALEVARYLVERGTAMKGWELVDALVHGSCQPQKQATIAYVIASRLCEPLRQRDAFVYAPTRAGGANVLQWSHAFLTDAGAAVTGQLSFYASYFVHVDLMRWLFDEHGVASRFVHIRKPATQQALLDFYKWMHQYQTDVGTPVWTADNMDAAAQLGYLDVVQWLHTNRTEGCTTSAMDWAAGCGHLHVVQWLHANRTEGCTVEAMNAAAGSGHLEVVQWLLANQRDNESLNTTTAMAWAAMRGQMEVVLWLSENTGDCCTRCALHAMLTLPDEYGGHLVDMIEPLNPMRWLLARTEEMPSSCVGRCHAPVQAEAEARAHHDWLGQIVAESGDLQLLQFVYEQTPDGIAPLAPFAQAIGSAGHLHIVQWLFTQLQQPRDDDLDWREVRDGAAEAQHESIVAWLDTVIDA